MTACGETGVSGNSRLRTGCIAEGLLSAFPPCTGIVDADGGGGCGSPGGTRFVGDMGNSRLCSSMLGNLTEGVRVRATAFTYRSASWTRPSTWLSEARENRCSMPDRVVSSDNFY